LDDAGMKPITNKVSHASVAETVACLIAQVETRALRYFTTIDHSAEATAVGLELRETQLVVFGNPHEGTPIMHAAPLAGLDLPLKVLVARTGIGPASATPRPQSSRLGIGAARCWRQGSRESTR
jgi:uncharacterized protein (DUF302 family)